MNSIKPLPINRASAFFLALASLVLVGSVAQTQSPPHLTTTQPGGFPGWPPVTGVLRTTNGVTVTWDGPSGYYQLYQSLSITDPLWQKVGTPNFTRNASLPSTATNAFFKVSGPLPQYAGAQTCIECHESVHSSEMDTRHARAFETLRAINEHQNPSCLPCHSVGYNLPTGFVSESATPHLMGVQCESCHGPAANHAASDSDILARPRRELAAQVCGGCHSVARFPTHQEWTTSGHAKVTEDMNPSGRISSCGRCHSGSARLSLLKGQPLPTGDANVEITCAVCHDPHSNHVWTNPLNGNVTTNLLRNPVASTNDYVLTTSDNFAAKYNPAINICGQCHNHRGASWSSSSRPPHYSPQYNMLLGTVGELTPEMAPTGPSTHALEVDKQCVGCHMPTDGNGSAGPPTLPHHSFKVRSLTTCLECHNLPAPLVSFTRLVVNSRIQQVKSLLDQWALQKAPAPLLKYGALAWEYDNAGSISNPSGTLRGPVSNTTNPTLDEQKFVPNAIKKARFNLYLVLHDGSYGVHNPLHTIALLEAARDWVAQELAP